MKFSIIIFIERLQSIERCLILFLWSDLRLRRNKGSIVEKKTQNPSTNIQNTLINIILLVCLLRIEIHLSLIRTLHERRNQKNKSRWNDLLVFGSILQRHEVFVVMPEKKNTTLKRKRRRNNTIHEALKIHLRRSTQGRIQAEKRRRYRK